MHAVKAGPGEVVEILTRCNSLDYNIKNKVRYAKFSEFLLLHFSHSQKQQDVFHVAAREGQLECLELLCTKSPPGALLSTDEVQRFSGILQFPNLQICNVTRHQ